MFQPDYLIENNLPVSDTEPSQIQNETKPDLTVIPTEEVAAATIDESVDVRPRVHDGISKEWVLVDTGSQCSVLKPGPDDRVNPFLKLEAVNGAEMPCYGKKSHSVRLGRKTYHIEAVISDTTDTILGMDFIEC